VQLFMTAVFAAEERDILAEDEVVAICLKRRA